MSPIILQEVARYPVITNKYVESTSTFKNTSLTVVSDRGLEILEFSHNLSSFNKNIDVTVLSIPCPKTCAVSSLFPPNFLEKEITNQKYTQCLIESTLWPHDENYLKELVAIQSFEWSPSHFILNNKPALAVLSNVGNVNLFIRCGLKYKCILNLSSLIMDRWRNETNIKLDFHDIEVLTDTSKKIVSYSICWGPKTTNGFYFVTAQRNGNIMLWYLNYKDNKTLSADTQCVIDTNHGEVIKMIWITKSNNEFLLVCSYLNGEIYTYACKIHDKIITLNEAICLWKYQDKMPAKHMEFSFITDNKLLLVCSKHRHVLVLVLDNRNNVVCHTFKNINDHKIVTVINNCDRYFVATANCKLFTGDIVNIENNLNDAFTEIQIKDSYSDYILSGLSVSENNVIWALNLFSNKIAHKKHTTKTEITYLLSSDSDQTSINLLLNNPTGTLTNMWDCIEVLRYKACKAKTLPKIDYNLLIEEAVNNIYKLKIYLILLTLYRNHIIMSYQKNEYIFPETSIEKIKDELCMHHAITLLNNIKQLHRENGKLTDIQKEVFLGSKMYLQYFCEKYERIIDDYLKQEHLDLIADIGDNVVYVCQGCDDNLVNLKCKHNHLNLFCSVTFTPILTDDYLVCKGCNALARKDLYLEKPTCIFCDLYFDNFNLFIE